MIERIRISLWDVFAFFTSGCFAAICFAAFLFMQGSITDERIELASKLPTALVLVVTPIIMMISGMLIEPLANSCERFILGPVIGLIFSPFNKNKDDVETESGRLEKLIEEQLQVNLGDESPYHYCKDYLIMNGLADQFNVFLSRFGFYRNASFICLILGCASFSLFSCSLESCITPIISWPLALIYRKRSNDFFSYLAPTEYRSFLAHSAQSRNAPNKVQENAG